jgi:hypothetical protein
MNTMFNLTWRFRTSLLSFILISLFSISISHEMLAQNLGYEATPATTPPNNWTAVSGTWNVSTNPVYVRTGTQSMTITDPATTGSTVGTTSPVLTTTSSGYLITIGWGKSNTASNALFHTGYRTGTINTLNPTTTTSGQPANLNDVTWSRIVSVSASGTIAAGNYGVAIRAFRSAAVANTQVYLDDFIIYGSSSNVPDLSAPNAATGTSIAGNVLSWTNGTDNGAPASGIGGVVIIRADGASVPTPSLNDQAMYNPVHGAAGVGSFVSGGNTWTVVASINNSTTTSFNDATAGSGPYTYVIFMRDLAFNYSSGVVVLAASACTSPPVPGTPIANPNTPQCAGTTINLSISGGTAGIGQTYQWQSSPTSGSGFTNIGSSSSNPGLSVNPLVSTYYRCIITCSSVSSTSAEIFVPMVQPLSGTYTINNLLPTGGTNFNSFTDAINALACGVSSTVTFNVSAGQIFNEPPLSISFNGSSSLQVIFQRSGVGVNPEIRVLGTSGTSDHILRLFGADFITFNGINFSQTGTSASDYVEFGIYLQASSATDGCQNNTFKNGVVTLNEANASSKGINTVVASPSATSGTNSSNKFLNMIVRQAIMGYHFVGSSTAGFGDINNEINTELGGFSQVGPISITTSTAIYGVRTSYQANFKCYNTEIANISSTSTGLIYAFYDDLSSTANPNSIEVKNCKVYNITGGGTLYGIYMNATGSVSLVENNEVYALTTGGASSSIRGIFALASSSTTKIYKNRVYNITANGTTTTTASGIELSTGLNHEVINNMISDIKGFSSTSTASGVRGISVVGGTASTFKIINNTVNLTGTSLVAGNNNSALYISTTTPVLLIQNNIFINNIDVTSGTRAVALWRTTTATTNLDTDNNFNIYYAGTPGPKNLIYYNGTAGFEDMPSFTGSTGWSPRDLSSYTENTLFQVSPLAMGIMRPVNNIATYVESRATAVTGINDDFEGTLRGPYPLGGQVNGGGSAPDIGADEGDFTLLVAASPPDCATLNSPLNGATGVCVFGSGISLEWTPASTGPSPSAGFDVYLGTNPNPPFVANTNTNSYQPAGLLANTTYYWKIVPKNFAGDAVGCPVFSFTTANIQITSTTPGSRCGIGTVSLSATAAAGNTVAWYANATGGVPLATGTGFVTPSLSATTTYYAAASLGGANENVASPTAGTSTFFSASTGWGLRFTVNQQCIINTVMIKASNSTAGSATMQIRITDLADVTLYSGPVHAFSITTTLTEYVIPVGINIPPGDYKMVMTSSGISSLVRESGGVTFPYNAPSNAVSITAGANGTGTSQTTTAYYWFYNWTIITGCEGPRVPVTATVNLPLTTTITNPILCGASATTQLNANTGPGSFNFSWTNGGTLNNATIANPVATPPVGVTTYTVTVSDNNSTCVLNQSVTVTKMDPGVTSTTDGSRCGTGPVNLQATATSGAQINWYNTSTGGSVQAIGNTYMPVISSNTTFYASAVQTSVQTPVSTGFGGGTTATDPNAAGNMFDIVPQQNVKLTGFDIHLQNDPLAPSNISVYYRVGTHIGSELVAANWTLLGSATGVVSAGVGVPTNLPITLDLNLTAGQTYGFYIVVTNLGVSNSLRYNSGATSPAQGAVAVSSTALNIVAGTVVFGPFTGLPAAPINRLWNGRVKFSYFCETSRVPVNATLISAPPITASTSNSAVCNGSSATLSAASALNPNYTYTWTPGNLPGATVVVNPTVSTSYTVNAIDNSGMAYDGCAANATVNVDVLPSVASVAASPVNLCLSGTTTITATPASGYPANSLQWQSSPNGISYSDIPGAIASSYTTPVINSSTYYRLQVKDGNGAVCLQPSTLVTVNNPQVVSTTPGSRCGAGTVNLQATASSGANLNWYANSSGGSPLGSGANFTTPLITTNTNFYVAASSGGGSANAGLPTALPTATSGAGTTNFGLVFDALAPFTLQSVVVYPVSSVAGTAGTVTIAVIDANNVELHSTTVNVLGYPSSSPVGQTVNLNFNIVPGTNLKLRPTARGTGITGLLFEPAAAAPAGNYGYPFVVPGVLSINTSTLTAAPTNTARNDLYYYFYNWTITTGCESPRTAVLATVNPAPAISVTAMNSTICLGNSTTIEVSSSNSNYTYTWSSVPAGFTANGQGPHTVIPTGSSTTYQVIAEDNSTGPFQGCGNFATVVVNTTPNNLVLSAGSTTPAVCDGQNAQLFATGGIPVPANGYTFSQGMNTYTPITGGSLIAQATNHTSSSESSLHQGNFNANIGFNFFYNGNSYSNINVNANGFITFGTTLPSVSLTTPISSTTAYAGAIAAMARDLWGVYGSVGTRTLGSAVITGVTDFTGLAVGKPIRGTGIATGATVTAFDTGAGTITMSANATSTSTATYIGWPVGEIRVQTIGTSPNRTCVIQYSGFSDFATTAPTGNFMNFQIRLFEGGVSGVQTISVMYGPQTNLSTTSRTQQVGLRGATTADFNNRTSTTDWSATTAGTTSSSTVTRTNVIFPANGLTFIWTPPAPPALSYAWTGNNLSSSSISNPVALNLTSNETYSVMITDQNSGCTKDQTFTVTVNPNPMPGAFSNSPVCESQDILLFASDGNNYTWTGPNGYTFTTPTGNAVISGSTTSNSGTYDVTVTNTFGCTTQESVYVQVNENPSAALITTTPVSCDGFSDGSFQVFSFTGTPFFQFTELNTFNTNFTGYFDFLTDGTYYVDVVDINGCQSVAPLAVTVSTVPNVAPVISCPSNISVNTDAGLCGAVVNYPTPVGTDVCPVVGTVQTSGLPSGAVFPLGTTINTFVVTDVLGLTASCSFTVTVTDNTPPAVVCQNVTVVLDANGNGSTTAAAVNNGSSDACGIQSLSLSQTAFTCANVGPNTVTLTVTDNNSNTATCTAIVTVVDNVAPVALCQNVTIYLDASGNASTSAAAVNNGSSDACGVASLSLSQTQFNCSHVGNNTVVLTVTDLNGNSSTCSAMVTVVDNINPVISCNAPISVFNNPGVCGATVTYTVTSGDNCPGYVMVQTAGLASGSVFPIGTTVNTFLVTDASGNTASCSFPVTVTDNEAPTITNVPVNFSACNPISWTPPAITDNCPGVQVTSTHMPGSVFPSGSTTVTYTATDVYGLQSTASFVVTVLPPSIAATGITSNRDYNNICLGENITLTLNGGQLGHNAVWQWYAGGCGAGTAIGTGTSITVTPSVTTTYYARAEGSCNNTACVQLQVVVSTGIPSGAVTFSYLPNFGAPGVTDSVKVNPVPGATFYRWFTNNGQINGVLWNGQISPVQTAIPKVDITFVLPQSNYQIRVMAGNACGRTGQSNAHVRGTVEAPTSLTGPTLACPGQTLSYTVSAVAGNNVTYNWQLIPSSAGTISGTGLTRQVTFAAGFTTAQLCVNGISSFGLPGAPLCIVISTNAPTPGMVSGLSTPCQGSTHTYSIAAVTGATSYNWTSNIPGVSIVNNGTSATVTFPASAFSGNICVTANSACGVSAASCKPVTSGAPGVPGPISGPTQGICGASNVNYSLSTSNANSYQWNVPAGVTISGAGNMNSVNLNFGAGFTSGTIEVIAFYDCGSASSTLSVNGAPAAPAITPATICAGTTELYFSSSTGAVSYNWTVTGADYNNCTNPPICSQQYIEWGISGGSFSVTASNSCGTSAPFNLSTNCRVSDSGELDTKVYPNPTSGQVTVEFTSNTGGKHQLTVTDLSGRVVLVEEMKAVSGLNRHDIDLGFANKGLYMLYVKNQSGKISVTKVAVE